MKRALMAIVAIMLLTVVFTSFTREDVDNLKEKPTKGILNGHEWVDLGLPSGLLWATCNIGASDPHQAGNYFAWGEVETKEKYLWETYKWAYKWGKDSEKLTKYCLDSRDGYKGFVDSLTMLEPCDDAATVNWGSGWRTPTIEDFEELLHVCKWDWKEEIIHQSIGLPLIKNWGYRVTGPNGSSIFLSPTGFKCPGIHDSHIGNYWASTLKPNELYHGAMYCGLTFWRGGDPYIYYFYSPMYGLPIRPVCSAKR